MSTAASRRKGCAPAAGPAGDPVAEPPGARRRGRPPKGAGQGEADLIAAAARAFSEHGFQGATLRGIAAAAGVDPALIAYRYGGKTALWRAVIEDLAEQVEAALDAAGGAADRRLAALVDGLAGLACRRPELVRLILRESTCAEVGERAALIRDVLTRPIHARLLPLVAAVEASRPEPDRADPEVRLFALLGAVCMVLATRPSLAAFTDIAADEARLRDELRRSLRLPAPAPAPVRAAPPPAARPE